MGIFDFMKGKVKQHGEFQMKMNGLQARWQSYQTSMTLIERAKEDLATASETERPPLEIYNMSNRVSGEMYDLLCELMDTYPALMGVALQGEEAVVQIEQMRAVKFKLERKPKATPHVEMKQEATGAIREAVVPITPTPPKSPAISKEPQSFKEWKAKHPDASNSKLRKMEVKFRREERKKLKEAKA